MKLIKNLTIHGDRVVGDKEGYKSISGEYTYITLGGELLKLGVTSQGDIFKSSLLESSSVVESYFFGGLKVTRDSVIGNLIFWKTDEGDSCIITDLDLNLLAEIRAHCSHNFGYIGDITDLT